VVAHLDAARNVVAMKNALLYLGIVVILAAGGMFYFAREAYEDDQLSIALDCFAGVDCGASPSLTWWPAALVALVGAGMIYASTKVKSDTPDG
jgi:hypothetical protein